MKALMKSDPIVDEIRAVRKAHAAQFNNDLNAILLLRLLSTFLIHIIQA